MALKARLSVTQTQNLVLTPALRVSIQLLQLSGQDLEAFIEQKSEENPFLERLESPVSGGRRLAASDALDPLESRVADQPSLIARLLDQVRLAFADGERRRLAIALIAELDEAGYLGSTLDEIADQSGCALETLQQVLARLQAFEPAGIFARDLRESLALQLVSQGRMDDTFRALLEKLSLLASGGASALAEVLELPLEEVEERLAILRRLDPKPGLSFQNEAIIPLVPDLLVTSGPKGRLEVAVNPDIIPRIRLDRHTHSHLLPRIRRQDDRAYVSEQVREVAWLRRALARRFQTLLAVGQAILTRQGDYFSKGPSGLLPLTRRNLAEELELSEATISRVVANKFLASPRGTEPLKRFFSAALGPEGDVSAAAAQARLRELVAAEPPARPLSDAKLAAKLNDVGLPVARRTVAKYRDLLRIPPAADRRRLEALRGGERA